MDRTFQCNHVVFSHIDPVKLDRLAEVAVKVGLQLQPGQDLLLTAPSVALPLVRKVAEHASQVRRVRDEEVAAREALRAEHAQEVRRLGEREERLQLEEWAL